MLKYNNQNKKEIENPNINLNPGNIDNQIKNFSSNNLASNGMFFYQLCDNNKIINNFIGNNIINICFKIDGKPLISAPASPNDKLGDVFMLALKRKNKIYLSSKKYSFFYDVRNITDKFSSNESINSLNLTNNCIIEVYS